MTCLVLIIFLAFPRIALFLFLPLPTLAYAWMANTGQPTTGMNLLILIMTAVIDLGGLGGGAYHRRRE